MYLNEYGHFSTPNTTAIVLLFLLYYSFHIVQHLTLSLIIAWPRDISAKKLLWAMMTHYMNVL